MTLTKLIARLEPCQMGTHVLSVRTQGRRWSRIADDLCVSTPTVRLWATCARLRNYLNVPASFTIEELH
ncbi:hypothetical protein OHB26_09560 [Nocardia sp. NBC_01503]|uniref:hypothetical protein n=1 Tax=Nocardia sp. NBC_01503 TaxID=2975997 RepID=UPI002E7B4EA5|nr:hypothetical protein [Nocardia sp. NBC_01503]WTL34422.1 hypothetical protein OHB26_09560 [Nocardia sp. NBC_01503]